MKNNIKYLINKIERFFFKRNTCQLCLKEARLRKSHIYPKHFYKSNNLWGKGTKQVFRLSANSRKSKAIKDINFNGHKERLLCGNCEQLLNNNYESYYSEIFSTKNPIPKKYKIIDECVLDQNGFKFRSFTNVDYSKIKLYVLSILWRCSVSLEFSRACKMKKEQQERLRQMVLKRDAGQPKEFPILFFTQDEPQKGDNEQLCGFFQIPYIPELNVQATLMGTYIMMVKMDNVPIELDVVFKDHYIVEGQPFKISMLKRKEWSTYIFEFLGLGSVLEKNHKLFPQHKEVLLKAKKEREKINN